MTLNEIQHELGAHLDHVGIAVKNLEAAATTYSLFGLQQTNREIVTEQKVEVAILPAGSTRLELLCPTAEESPVARFIARRGEGLHHIALRVADLRQTLKKCQELNLKLIDEEPRLGAEGCLIAFIHPASTNGVLLELTQTQDSKL